MSSGDEATARMDTAVGVAGQSRVFADASAAKPADWFDWEGLAIAWTSGERYELVAKIGRGHFGEVFEAVDSVSGRRVVVKVLKPVRDEVIQKEVKFLTNMRDGPNIVRLLDTVLDETTQQKSLVFEYVHNPDFKALYTTFSDMDVRFYMFQLLRALQFTHSNGIIHRDIKPHNVLIDPERRVLRLIDWGLAAYYRARVPFTKFPGTRVFKAPELLLQYEHYDYAADMWSFGCLLGGIVLQRHPLFRGRKENMNVLQEIVRLLGSDALATYTTKYAIAVPPALRKKLKGRPKVPLTEFVHARNRHLAHDDALDLVGALLQYDHEARLTVVETMAHRYFDPVRHMPAGEPSDALVDAAVVADAADAPPRAGKGAAPAAQNSRQTAKAAADDESSSVAS